MTDNKNHKAVITSHDKQMDSLGVIDTIVQTLALSGCNKAESDLTATHLIQGLHTGRLEGENFRVVIYYAPRLAQTIDRKSVV